MLHVLLAATVLANSPTLARLRERENQYTQGTLHKNATLISGVLAPDFIDTTSTGAVIRKRAYLENLADPSWSLQRLDVWGSTYLMHGDAAVVNAEYRMTGRENGKPVVQHGRATDVWVWEQGDWWCIAAHSSVIPDR